MATEKVSVMRNIGIGLGIVVIIVSFIFSGLTYIRQTKLDIMVQSSQLFYPLSEGRKLEEKVDNLENSFDKMSRENREDHKTLLKGINDIKAVLMTKKR